MMKIDVNKSGRIFDFLVTSGMMVLQYDPFAKPIEVMPSTDVERLSLTEVRINGVV
jgi:hypothetical protein